MLFISFFSRVAQAFLVNMVFTIQYEVDTWWQLTGWQKLGAFIVFIGIDMGRTEDRFP